MTQLNIQRKSNRHVPVLAGQILIPVAAPLCPGIAATTCQIKAPGILALEKPVGMT